MDKAKYTAPVSHLKSMWDLRKLCNCWFLVHEFLLIQIPKFGSVEANSEVSSKHPLMVLLQKKGKLSLAVITDDPFG